MKPTISLLFIIVLSSSILIAHDCSISLEPCWNNLEQKNTKNDTFGGQWILIGSITFRKKSKEEIKLDQINLCWHGDKIERLAGSLYKKLPSKKFIPIEENLLCDGTWDCATQSLVLDFSNRKQTLGPLNIFYIVLTVPEQLEPTLKKGRFSLTKAHLPEPFGNQNSELTLNIAQFINQQITPQTKG